MICAARAARKGGGLGRTLDSSPLALGAGRADARLWCGIRRTAWVQIVVITALFIWLFYMPNLHRLWLKTNPFTGEANWRHSICIPFIGLYYLYIHRRDLLAAPLRPLMPGWPTRQRTLRCVVFCAVAAALYVASPWVMPATQVGNVRSVGVALFIWGMMALVLEWGLGSMLFGIGLFGFGIWPGQNDFVKDFGMVVTLFGVVLLLCGWDVMRIAWFPIAFLVCAIPWPGLVYSYLAWPLQLLAAKVAVGVLSFTGVTAGSVGTRIFIGGGASGELPRALNVAEACSGLRSLMTFISVGAAVAFLSQRRLWEKVVITVSAVPIAIACNVARVAGQGLLDHWWGHEVSEGFAHQFVGLAMLVPAFFLILMVGWFLDRLFVDEVADKTELTDAVVRRGAGAQPEMATVTPPPPMREGWNQKR